MFKTGNFNSLLFQANSSNGKASLSKFLLETPRIAVLTTPNMNHSMSLENYNLSMYTSKYTHNTISNVVQVGYSIREKLLRPAMVTVTKNINNNINQK